MVHHRFASYYMLSCILHQIRRKAWKHTVRIICTLILLAISGQLSAQTLDLEINIKDGFLKVPLKGVSVSVCTTDSVLVTDSIQNVSFTDRNGKPLQEIYIATVKAEKKDYLVHATLPGYGEVWKPVSVTKPDAKSVSLEIDMRKERSINLQEVVVKATKLKMYYKGDTIVYDASAFNLPEGSMLEDLIRQLPGVTMNGQGEIFVNGRKVDELLLSARSFFKGNKKILLENLPYYTVKNVKVYDKQTDMSEALGYDVEPRLHVMDVNLKEESSKGYIGNVEGAVGTGEKWLARSFLLGFTDRWRYSAMANLNNVNETRHIGTQGDWTPASMPQSRITTRSVATDLNYESKGSKLKNTFNGDFTSTSTDMKMSQRSEQFFENYNTTSLADRYSKSDNWRLKLSNNLVLKEPFYLNSQTSFEKGRRNGHSNSQFAQWGDELDASMRTRGMSKGRSWMIYEFLQGAFNIDKEKQQNISFTSTFSHAEDRSWLSDRYDTWQVSSRENVIQRNANDVSERTTSASFAPSYQTPEIYKQIRLAIRNDFQYLDTKRHDYLYHPDTLLLASQLDMLSAITDMANSYDSHKSELRNVVQLSLNKPGSYKINNINITYDRWRIGADMPVIRQSLDYKRGAIDTLMHDMRFFISPGASFRHMSQDGKHDFRAHVSHKSGPADLLNQVAIHDDSQPLLVKLGNPSLKGTSSSEAGVEYTDRFGTKMRQWHVGASFNYHHRDVAQAASYDPATGVYTYQPKNVRGAYTATARFDFSRGIDKDRRWTWQTNADANYHHSVDYSMLAGETESHENIVNTVSLHNGSFIQYTKDKFSVRASGDIKWRHSEGKMIDFETLNIVDFNYGLSARYTIPMLKTTVTADATMYSRRGYGNGLNTDDFIVNASLKQPLWKGRLIAGLDVFDLFHQISSVRQEVSAQGRVVTWYRSLPHYLMFHLTLHWNKNPRK